MSNDIYPGFVMYALHNGPILLAMSEDIQDILVKKERYPDNIRPFLTISEKENGHWRHMSEQDIETIMASPVGADEAMKE